VTTTCVKRSWCVDNGQRCYVNGWHSGECGGLSSGISEELRQGKANISVLRVNKSLFYENCMANPGIAEAVDFSVRVEAASKLTKDTGDDGQIR